MIITQLEGTVSSDQWQTLQQAFREAAEQLPTAIDQSYLIQDKNDQEVWCIVTIWKSQRALQDYRASIDTPGGILMFRAAGSEPTLTIYKVVDYVRHGKIRYR